MRKKMISWKEEGGTYIFTDLLYYLSYQIKWYAHKILLTCSEDVHWLLAKGVLLGWFNIICIIFFLSFQQSQPLNIKGIQLTHCAYLPYHIHQAQME